MSSTYTVHRTGTPPALEAAWDDPAWQTAETLTVGSFHPDSSGHRPLTRARMLHDGATLFGIFHVQDRYVLCRHLAYQGAVYRDACVEFFVKPRPDKGHMNFEMNCCGFLLCRYVEDPTRTPDNSFVKQSVLPAELGERIRLHGSLPGPIVEEIRTEVDWTLSFQIPVRVLEAFVGPLGVLSGQAWRANFNKCAEDCSHPHWATWAPIGPKLDFHQPDRFGTMYLE